MQGTGDDDHHHLHHHKPTTRKQQWRKDEQSMKIPLTTNSYKDPVRDAEGREEEEEEAEEEEKEGSERASKKEWKERAEADAGLQAEAGQQQRHERCNNDSSNGAAPFPVLIPCLHIYPAVPISKLVSQQVIGYLDFLLLYLSYSQNLAKPSCGLIATF
jgi:hypothetical protein